MDTEIIDIEVEKVKVLPEVGECWKKIDYPNIYIRIPDDQGERVFSAIKDPDRFFYSVDLSSGIIIGYRRNLKVILLHQETKAKFTEVKRNK